MLWDIDEIWMSGHLVQFSSHVLGGLEYVSPMMSWFARKCDYPEIKVVDTYDLAYLNPHVMIRVMTEILETMDYYWEVGTNERLDL